MESSRTCIRVYSRAGWPMGGSVPAEDVGISTSYPTPPTESTTLPPPFSATSPCRKEIMGPRQLRRAGYEIDGGDTGPRRPHRPHRAAPVPPRPGAPGPSSCGPGPSPRCRSRWPGTRTARWSCSGPTSPPPRQRLGDRAFGSRPAPPPPGGGGGAAPPGRTGCGRCPTRAPGAGPRPPTPPPGPWRPGRDPPRARTARTCVQTRFEAVAEQASALSDLRHDLLGDVEVRVDVLDIVELFKRVQQREDLPGLGPVHRYLRLRHHREFSGKHGDAGRLDHLADPPKGGGIGRDLPRAPGIGDVLGPGVERHLQELVLVDGRRLLDLHDALAREHPRGAPRIAEASAVPGERIADVLAGSVTVVGEGLHDERHSSGAIALVRDLLVAGPAAQLARSALDGAVDVVPWHGCIPGLVHRRSQRRVAVDAAPALLGRDLHGSEQLGERVAALGIRRRLLSLDRAPLGMSGHLRLPRDVLVQSRLTG